ncbi:MAG: LLM class flavin-dependent oxidoreductase [Nakamurella sp.]
MADHGRAVTFGSFLTPSAAAPEHTVTLAVLSEQIGLDLVTFQDHPYQPAFLDTWTLLSYVAARTDSVTLSANVLNLPLRPPAVIARSVAALDLLSGGRVELGLGAGGFWAAIEAMGGRRLSPAHAVQAVAEAITIIRELWNTDPRGGVRFDGEQYRVHGAKRGPAPAHDVGIWLGAYKPRMLELTGRVADGWLPSLAHLPEGGLAQGQARIDEAAAAAGRLPSEIRRLLNVGGSFQAHGDGMLQGPVQQWVEQLSRLVLQDGVDTFILATDDPDDLRRFAGEVAPAVRELVEIERAAPEVTAPQQISTGGGVGATSPELLSSRGQFAVVPTPDDGTRRSAQQVWDESERPSGPARDPAREYTPQEQVTGRHLVDVHDHLRAELAQIHDLIEQVAAGTLGIGLARDHINTMTLRQNNWTLGTYCESYCRVVTTHHTGEDRAMFPHLRRADPRLAPVVDRLAQEHMVIHEVLEGVDRALVALVTGPDGIAGLRAAVDLLSDTQLSHLSYEERELVEPLARLGMF